MSRYFSANLVVFALATSALTPAATGAASAAASTPEASAPATPLPGQTSPALNTPVVTLDSNGFTVAAPDKSYSFKLAPFIQADGRFYADNGKPNRDTLTLKRIRIYFDGIYGKTFGFRIAPEFASADRADANTQLADAWVSANFSPAFGLRAGKFFGPVSIGSSDDRHFIEPSYSNELSTNRDLGLEAAGSFAGKILSYRLGIYDGAPNNSWGETSNLSDGDFTVGGRLTLAPFAGKDSVFSGLSFAVGTSYGNEANGTRRIGTPGLQDVFRPRDAAGRDLKYSGDHLRVAPAIEWFSGAFSLATEFILERWDDATNGHISNYAWRVTAGWVLTGETSTNKGVTPDAPFSLETGHWGAWEFVARVGAVKVDSFYGHDIGAYSWGAGVNWYLTKNLIFRLNAEYTDFGGGVTATTQNELCINTRLHLSF